MPTDRTSFRQGDFVQGGLFPAAVAKRADDALRRAYPECSGLIEAAGPVPSAARLRELAAERVALAQRLADIKAKIAELRRAGKSS